MEYYDISKIKVSQSLPIPLHIQIKEQIKMLILTGHILPGDVLPPAVELAEQLKLNRNTINGVYNQLRDEGFVHVQKGKGTKVLDFRLYNDIKEDHTIMLSLLSRLTEETNRLGINGDNMMLSFIGYFQLFGRGVHKSFQVLFIECREHDYVFYEREIARWTGAQVETFFLEDIRGERVEIEEKLSRIDAIVTTLNHVEEVKKTVTGDTKKVVAIAATTDSSLLLDISKMAPGSKVGFVCKGEKGGEWMAQRIKEAGIEQIEYDIQGIDDKDKLMSLIERSDRIYASPMVYTRLKTISPEKVFLFPLKLEKSSEILLFDLKATHNNMK